MKTSRLSFCILITLTALFRFNTAAWGQDDYAPMTWEWFGEGASFTGDDGVQDIALSTESDGRRVYTIHTARGLAWVAYATNYALESKEVANAPERPGFAGSTIRLAADIDLSAAPAGITEFDTQWSPIGSSQYNAFGGIFDGDGRTISGVTVTKGDFAGLFGYVAPGAAEAPQIINLTVAGAEICGFIAGGLAGYCDGVTITDCSVSESKVSTLAPQEIDPAFESAYQSAGGIAGYMINGFLKNCRSSGSVTAGCCCGGIAGLAVTSQILNSRSSANVSASQAAGGISGAMTGGTLQDSYALGTIDSQGYAGGICGSVADKDAEFTASLQQCLALNIGGITAATASGTVIGVIDNPENWAVHSNYASILLGETGADIRNGVHCSYDTFMSFCGKDSLLPAYKYIGGGEITLAAGEHVSLTLIDKAAASPTAYYNEAVQFTAIADKGYKIKSVTVMSKDDDTSIQTTADGDTYTFYMHYRPVTITVTAEPDVVTHTITVTPTSGGKIEVYQGDEMLTPDADNHISVPDGTEITIKAVADSGYGLSWLKINDVQQQEATVNYEVTEDITLSASFYYIIPNVFMYDDVCYEKRLDANYWEEVMVRNLDYFYNDKHYTGDLKLPEKVPYYGTDYKVTAIDKRAFSGSSELKSVTMTSTVNKIGSYAFEGCTGLEKLVVKSPSSALGNAAPRTATRAAGTITLPEVGEHAFDDIIGRATLYVPEEWKAAVREDPVWQQFEAVKEMTVEGTVLAELTMTASPGGRLTAESVTSAGGTKTVKVAENTDVTVTVTADEGYILTSLMLGDTDVTDRLADGKLTISSLEGENSLTAVFSDNTGISSAHGNGSGIYAGHGTIIIRGAARGETVTICDAAGRVLRSEMSDGRTMYIPMPVNNVYIVRMGGRTVKMTL